MLTEAIIQTSVPTLLKIDDADPDEILILASISGLSDVKVTQFMGEFAREGSYYQGRRAEKRNPVFNFKLQPNYKLDIMPNEIRELLYRMFMEPQRDSDAVQVLLKDDKLPDRYFIGYTETMQADAWVKESKAQISLMTVDAYLRSAEETVATNALGWFTVPTKYEGTADTGLRMTVKVLFDTDELRVANGIDVMVFNGPFVAGDILELSTIQGERAVIINGVDRMAALTASPLWLTLKESQNVLRTYGTTVGDGKAVITAYEYRAAWWGA